MILTNTPLAGETRAETLSRYERPARAPKPTALNTQVGGSHYTDMAIQPAAYILANNLGWAEGSAIAYLSRWKSKGGVEDLRKAVQTIELLIETEERKDLNNV